MWADFSCHVVEEFPLTLRLRLKPRSVHWQDNKLGGCMFWNWKSMLSITMSSMRAGLMCGLVPWRSRVGVLLEAIRGSRQCRAGWAWRWWRYRIPVQSVRIEAGLWTQSLKLVVDGVSRGENYGSLGLCYV